MDMFQGAGQIHMGPGWAAFADPARYFQYGLVLVAATLSGAALAYHPVYRGRPVTLDDIEQRKTLIVYAVVGALIALVCTVNPSMALVIFGIGGLMRFRTELGTSKMTGQTIVAALIGLCWGLGLELVGVLATAYFWTMTWVLELAAAVALTVGGVAIADMGAASEAYRSAIQRAGGRITAHAKDFKKSQMSFVFRPSRRAGLEAVIGEVEQIPSQLRGTPDWSR
jgi:hypothetical protein